MASALSCTHFTWKLGLGSRGRCAHLQALDTSRPSQRLPLLAYPCDDHHGSPARVGDHP